MAEVIEFKRKRRLSEDGRNAVDTLEEAKERFSEVLVVGWDSQERLAWMSSAEMTRETALYLIEHYKRILLTYD